MKRILLILVSIVLMSVSASAANINNLIIDNDISGGAPWYSYSPTTTNAWYYSIISTCYNGNTRYADSIHSSYYTVWYTVFNETTLSYLGADVYLYCSTFNDDSARYRMYYTKSNSQIVFINDQYLDQDLAPSGYTYDLFDYQTSAYTRKGGGVGVHVYPSGTEGLCTGSDMMRINVSS